MVGCGSRFSAYSDVAAISDSVGPDIYRNLDGPLRGCQFGGIVAVCFIIQGKNTSVNAINTQSIVHRKHKETDEPVSWFNGSDNKYNPLEKSHRIKI